MRIMQVLLWENQRRESIIIRDDSDTIKEKFINQYIDKHVPGYHEHIEIIHHYGYRGYLWEFCKKEGRKIIGEKRHSCGLKSRGLRCSSLTIQITWERKQSHLYLI